MVCTGFDTHTGLGAKTQTSSLSQSDSLLTEGSPGDRGVSFYPRGLHGRLGHLPGASASAWNQIPWSVLPAPPCLRAQRPHWATSPPWNKRRGDLLRHFHLFFTSCSFLLPGAVLPPSWIRPLRRTKPFHSPDGALYLSPSPLILFGRWITSGLQTSWPLKHFCQQPVVCQRPK